MRLPSTRARCVSRSAVPGVRARLAVEPLEDRLAPATFTVTNANDAGAGSLRSAITKANATAGTDTINFNIPSGAVGVHTINLLSALPAITDAVAIAGQTQPGYATKPLIELNGAGAGAAVSGLVIGASGSSVRALTINRFSGDGIAVTASNCVIAACYLGTDSGGTAAAANIGAGVRLSGTASGNSVRKNTVSGNAQAGVLITGAGATGNSVQGNLIGLNVAGTAAVANTYGVLVLAGATGNTIGGTSSDLGNTISGNGLIGVAFSGAGTASNTLSNNRIGTDPTGTSARGNAGDGVFIGNGAGSITVSNNVISGNGSHGASISSSANNVVTGNLIGTDATGTVDLGNATDGVLLFNASTGNLIGGTAAGAGNVISGNTQNGVQIFGAGTTGNRVQGNLIGTDKAGSADLGNGLDGVLVTSGATGNAAGGTAVGAGNVICFNHNGVQISGAGTTGNAVLGNLIGTTKSGAAFGSNSSSGVLITGGATSNAVGGTSAAARNVISGNGQYGVSIDGAGTTGNAVQRNYIGTDKDGTAAIRNVLAGVQVINGAAGNLIGGIGAGNVISGNDDWGVLLTGAGTSANVVRGNIIGADRTGTAKLPNGFQGVWIWNGPTNNLIGGAPAGAGNVISGNGLNGVLVTGAGTTGNVIRGNYVGMAIDGTSALGNGKHGIFVSDSAATTAIGGTATGAGNLIAHNGGAGVLIGNDPAQAATPNAGTGNSVQGNRIFVNGGLGIDLGTFGTVTANDLNDPDSGPNDLLNFPTLTLAKVVASGLKIVGSLNTELGKALRIEFFASPAADASGYGEGKKVIGTTTVDTTAANTANFNLVLAPTGVTAGQVVTATATDDDGNTSEFSLALTVV